MPNENKVTVAPAAIFSQWKFLATIILLLVVLIAVMSFYAGMRYEVVMASQVPTIVLSSNTSFATTGGQGTDQVAIDSYAIGKSCAGLGTIKAEDCLAEQNTKIETETHAFYGKIEDALSTYADPLNLDDSAMSRRDEYLASVKQYLQDAEKGYSTFANSFCTAITEHYVSFGGTAGSPLYWECVNEANARHMKFIQDFFVTFSDGKAPVPLN